MKKTLLRYKIAGEYYTPDAAKQYCQSLPEPSMVSCISQGKEIEERSDYIWEKPQFMVKKLYNGATLIAAFAGKTTLINAMDMIQVCNPEWTKSGQMIRWCEELRQIEKNELYSFEFERLSGYPFDLAKELFPDAKGYVKGGTR